MSVKEIKKMYSKALSDAAFRDLLLSDPFGAAKGFDLTKVEVLAISSISKDKFVSELPKLTKLLSSGTSIWNYPIYAADPDSPGGG